MASVTQTRNCAAKVVFLSRCVLRQRSTTAMTGLGIRSAFHPLCIHRCASSRTPRKSSSTSTQKDEDVPIPYTTSKALDWSVHNSYGRHKKRPWYKVAPISIGFTLFLAWAFLRKETEIDRQLEIKLHERLPHLFEDPNKKGVEKIPTDTLHNQESDDS